MQSSGGWRDGGGGGGGGGAAPPAYEHRVRLLQARLEAALPKLAEALESRGGALRGPAPAAVPPAAPEASALQLQPLAAQGRGEGGRATPGCAAGGGGVEHASLWTARGTLLLQPAALSRTPLQLPASSAAAQSLPLPLPLPLPPLPLLLPLQPPPPQRQQQQRQSPQPQPQPQLRLTAGRGGSLQGPTAVHPPSPAWAARETRLRWALEAARATGGPRAPATLAALHEHAALLVGAGLAREAEAEACEALDGRWALLGAGDVGTEASYALVVDIFKAQGVKRNNKKLRGLRERLEGGRGSGPPALQGLQPPLPPPPPPMPRRELLATNSAQLGRAGDEDGEGAPAPARAPPVPPPPAAPQPRSPAWEAQEARLRGAVEAARVAAGASAPTTLTALHEYAALLAGAGLAREAEAAAREALAGRWALLGVGDAGTQASFALVVDVFRAQGVKRYHSKMRDLKDKFMGQLLEQGGSLRVGGAGAGGRGGRGGGGDGGGGGASWGTGRALGAHAQPPLGSAGKWRGRGGGVAPLRR
jgi:hypothetical protein